jgi:NADPH:quinone reductase-like Zn-dependent oxidoreductase
MHLLKPSQNCALAIQPLDSSILKLAYFPFEYPLIPGNNVAGTIVAIGSSVRRFIPGDRVVSDTPMYVAKVNKYGGWQKYVTSLDTTTCKIPDGKSFDEAVVMSFSLLTAVSALTLNLGMPKPDNDGRGNVLIWGGSGSVGGYAVQYAYRVSALFPCLLR